MMNKFSFDLDKFDNLSLIKCKFGINKYCLSTHLKHSQDEFRKYIRKNKGWRIFSLQILQT